MPRPAPAPGKMAALARPSPENFQDCPAPKMPRVLLPRQFLNIGAITPLSAVPADVAQQ